MLSIVAHLMSGSGGDGGGAHTRLRAKAVQRDAAVGARVAQRDKRPNMCSCSSVGRSAAGRRAAEKLARPFHARRTFVASVASSALAMSEKLTSGPSASRRSLVEASSKLASQAPFTHRSLQGRGGMPPVAWHQVTLPAAGPALRRRPLPPSPRGAMPAEYVEHAERLRAAEEAEARRKAALAATTLSTPRLQEARREELAKLSAAMAPPQGSPRGVQPRSRAKVTLTAGLLSGAGTCHALMVGNMTPAAFAESASAMPQATQVTPLTLALALALALALTLTLTLTR